MLKITNSTLALLIGLLTTHSLVAQKYSTVKIVPPSSKVETAALLGDLEIDHYQVMDGGIIAEIDESQLSKLSHTRFNYTILVDDIGAKIRDLNREYFSTSPEGRVAIEQSVASVNNLITTPSAFQVHATFGGFYSFAQMNTAMNNLVAAYPGLVQKTSLGLSTQGRDIWCIKISDNVMTDEANEPEILYMGLQHAREAIGGSAMIFFMQWLCENYTTDPRVQSLVNGREIFIIPCMNPDGWEYNRVMDSNGGYGWRKNRRNNGDGTFGVDLNRNWGIDWGNCSGAGSSCGSSSTSSDTYYGPSAFSEPETNAIRNFTLSHHLVACIDQHAYGPYYSLPFGRPSIHTGADTLTVQQQQFYKYISALMGKYNGMRAGNSIQSVGYEVAGGVKDWMLKGEIGSGSKGIILGLTGEGGAGGGTAGTYGSFWPPASQIVNLCKGIVYQNLQLALAAGTYVELTDQSDIEVNAASGNFLFKVKRIGLENTPFTVSLVPVENISTSGVQQTINSMSNYFDEYTDNISYSLNGSIKPGDRIRYAWRVQAGGQTYDDTVVKFYNPTVLFYDDMEGTVTTNWVVSANWNYTNTLAYSGSKSLTESPAGLYGANRNDNIRYNGTFDLSDATAAYLTFKVRHRAENFCDKLQVQVSTNGTTWVAVAGRTTVQEPGTLDGSTINGIPALTGIREDWTPEAFDLSAYIGQTALRLRLVFTSDANTTGYDFQVDEGFNIDELKVIKSTNVPPILPVTSLELTGAVRNNSAELKWKLVADLVNPNFIIEKSVDGRVFAIAGTTDSSHFIDLFPADGLNFYRIKCVDGAGKTVYSNQVLITFAKQYFITVYPNPVQDELQIKIVNSLLKEANIQVRNLAGQIIYSIKPELNTGNVIRINTANWPAQLYTVILFSDRNDIFEVKKVFKL